MGHLRVLLIGPDPSVKGGVSHGIKLMLKYPPPDVEYQMLPTITAQFATAGIPKRSFRYIQVAIGNLCFFLKAYRKIAGILNSECKPHLAHVRFSSYGSTFRKGLIARLLARKKVPFVLSAHGSMYVSFYNSLQPFIKQWVRKMFLLSQGLIVLSESWKEFYQSIICDGSIPIWILPNAVELPAEPIAWDTTHDLRLLFLGLMTERKGSDRVLKAVARLPQPTRSKVSVFMAGNGMVEAMQSLATGLGISDRVTIRDWIQAEQKEAWLRDTNAFILPSQYEGLPNAMLEAMAWGKALIVSPVGGIPEFVTDGVEGFLVPPDDIDAIADAIRKLAENPELRMQMGMAARKRIEPLHIQNYRVRLGQIYREAFESANRK